MFAAVLILPRDWTIPNKNMLQLPVFKVDIFCVDFEGFYKLENNFKMQN